jgi:hypothetical protein
LDQGPIGRARQSCENSPISGDFMRKLTPTLTQSGLLAVLLQYQRYKVLEVARRRAHRKQMRAALWSTLTWPWRVLTAPKLLSDSAEPLAEALRRHTFLRVAPSGTPLHFKQQGKDLWDIF